jgi:hypothetical protein
VLLLICVVGENVTVGQVAMVVIVGQSSDDSTCRASGDVVVGSVICGASL